MKYKDIQGSGNIIVVINSIGKDIEKWKDTIDPTESIRYAAQRWSADYFELVDIKYPEYNQNPIRNNGGWNGFTGTKMWQLVWIMENFTQYEKVLCLDNDVFINSKAPNIFDLLEGYDIASVLDGNPGRLGGAIYNISMQGINYGNCIEYLKEIPGFSEDEYLKNYINTGVLVFNTLIMSEKIKGLKSIMCEGRIKDYIEMHPSPIDQNLFSAWSSAVKLRNKILPMEWNWTAPDIVEEYDDFMGDMKPYIYHFCGTNLIKERIRGYNRWMN